MSEETNLVSRGTTTVTCYAIEARLVYPENPPIEVYGNPVDGVWRRINTYKSPLGVPNNIYDEQTKAHGYIEHDAAMALAYWFIAGARRSAVEVRLVEHQFVSTHEVTKKAELEPIRTHYFTPLTPNKRGEGRG